MAIDTTVNVTELLDRSNYSRVIEGKTFTSALQLTGHQYDNTLIINCTFKDSSGDGITLSNVNNVTIANCTIDTTEGTGIRCAWSGSGSNVTIIDNTIRGTGDNGISAGEDWSNVQIVGNTIDNCGTKGDLKGGDSGSVVDMHGMYICAPDVYIAKNYVTNSIDGNGISLRTSGIVENNLVDGSGKSGIAYYCDHPAGATNTVVIRDNYVSDSGNYETNRNDIDLLSPPNSGNRADNFVITGNTVTDTSSGVKVSSSGYSGASVSVTDNTVVSTSEFQTEVKEWLAAGYNNPTTSGGTGGSTGGGTTPTPTPTPTPAGQKVTGTDSADTLTGTSGTDTLEGGSGMDTLNGGAGNDQLTGGANGDTFVVTKGQGSDTVTDFYAQYSDVVQVTDFGLTSFTQVKSIMSQSGSDTVLKFASGETLTLKGVTSTDLTTADFTFKNAGTTTPTPTPTPVAGKTLNGTNSADKLTGDAGNDTLSGGAGKDTLTGGAGNDLLTGGKDGDTFVVAKAGGSDTITDFHPEYSDVVHLQNYGLTSLSAVKSIMTQSGADTVLKFSNGETLTIKDTTVSEFTSNDFTFSNSTAMTGLSSTTDGWS